MLKVSKAAGGSAQIGDLVTTNAQSLPAGNVLLPCDGSELDEVTYPELAAVLQPQWVLETSEVLNADNNNQVTDVGNTDPDLVDDVIVARTGNGGIFQLHSTTSARQSKIPLDTDQIATTTGYYLCGMNTSADGMYIYYVLRDGTVESTARLFYSSDGGTTFGVTNFTTYQRSAEQYVAGALSIHKDDPLHIRFAHVTRDQDIHVFESTDGGVTVNEVAGVSGTLPFSIGYTESNRGGTAIKFSDDLSTVIVGTYLLDKWAISTTAVPAFTEIARPNHYILGKIGGFIDIATESKRLFISALTHYEDDPNDEVNAYPVAKFSGYVYGYSDDDGATFTTNKLKFHEAHQQRLAASTEYSHDMHITPKGNHILCYFRFRQENGTNAGSAVVSVHDIVTGEMVGMSHELGQVASNMDTAASQRFLLSKFIEDDDKLIANLWEMKSTSVSSGVLRRLVFRKNKKLLTKDIGVSSYTTKIVADVINT